MNGRSRAGQGAMVVVGVVAPLSGGDGGREEEQSAASCQTYHVVSQIEEHHTSVHLLCFMCIHTGDAILLIPEEHEAAFVFARLKGREARQRPNVSIHHSAVLKPLFLIPCL